MNEEELAFIVDIPFHRHLGLNAESFDVENGCIRFDMQKELVGNMHFNILHGGMIATILDIEGAFVLNIEGSWRTKTGSQLTPRDPIKGGTIDLRIDYLRPAKGKSFIASGTVLRRGSKVGVVRSELRNEQDDLIAVGTGTYLVG